MAQMRKENGSLQVLMCCSDILTVKGGMVTVVNNLLSSKGWSRAEITYIPTHIESPRVAKAAYFAGAWVKILLHLMRNKVDVVHLHVSERGSVYRKAAILKLAKRFGKKVILHHHGADFDPFFRSLSEKDKAFVRRFLEAADRNVVLSELIRKEFLERCPGAKYSVVHNAVPVPEENDYDPDRDLVVTLGRLGQRKGTYDLIRALEALDPELPQQIRFCFCGDGDVEQVSSLLREKGLEHRVAHLGWAAGEKKKEILSRTMCHVLPSYREGLPMSILETMSMGIPNISTAIASIPEVIDNGVQGILIQPGDVEALKDALRRVCGSRELRRQMSEESYSRVREHFSAEAGCRKLEKIYAEVLGARP